MFEVGGWVGAAYPAICAVVLRIRVLCLLFGNRRCRFVSGLCATDSPPSFAPFHASAFSVSGIACKPWARERCIEQPHSHKAPPHSYALSRSCAVGCGGALGCALSYVLSLQLVLIQPPCFAVPRAAVLTSRYARAQSRWACRALQVNCKRYSPPSPMMEPIAFANASAATMSRPAIMCP